MVSRWSAVTNAKWGRASSCSNVIVHELRVSSGARVPEGDGMGRGLHDGGGWAVWEGRAPALLMSAQRGATRGCGQHWVGNNNDPSTEAPGGYSVGGLWGGSL